MISNARFGAFDGRFLGIDLEARRIGARPYIPWLPPGGGHRDTITRLLRGVDAADAFSELLEATAATHELRHFHDFLLSPIGSYAMRGRLLGALNTLPLLPWIIDQGRAVPVPLNAWIGMNQADRDAYWARASSVHRAAGRDIGPPLDVSAFDPDLALVPDSDDSPIVQRFEGDAEVRSALNIMGDQFARGDSVLGGLSMAGEYWSPAQLFEANALLTQVQHLRLVTNQTIASTLLSSLATGHGGYSTVLARMARTVGTVTRDGASLPSSLVLLLNTYALLGSCEPDHFYGQAIVRFCTVGLHLAKRQPDIAKDVRELYEEWDAILAREHVLTMPAFKGIERSLALDDQLAEFLDREVRDQRAPDPMAPLKTPLRAFLSARRALCSHFLRDPDSYVRPKLYLASLSDLPRPAVRITSMPDVQQKLAEILDAEGWSPYVRASESELIAEPAADFLGGQQVGSAASLGFAGAATVASEMMFADSPAVTDAGWRALTEFTGGALRMVRVVRPASSVPTSTRGEKDALSS